MNQILKSLFIALVLTVSTSVVSAQELKFGHLNSMELMSTLPEKDAAQKQIEEHAAQLEQQQQNMQTELQQKYEEYLSQRDSYSDLVKATKEKDLQDLQQRIQTFNQVASQDLQKKEAELLKPIIEKVQAAIEVVGKENGFLYIFDLANRSIVYHSDQSVDVTGLVRKKLGLEN